MAQKMTRERRDEIARALIRDGKVSAAELSRRYAVSAETIRKDLLWLEGRGVAEKSYGGAIATTQAMERSFFEKATRNPKEKAKIAKAVAEMVPAGATVLLDSGSTVAEVARQLAARTDVAFFTNSLEAAQLLAEKKRPVCILGGAIRLSSRAATGAWATEMLSQLNADVAILGTSGFEGSAGPCVESMEECEVKRAMLRAAKRSILVADSTKSRCRAPMRFASWAEISLVVTDAGIDAELLSELRNSVETIVL
ncbi:MAG: DeoR/GlpR transcriptional regulator [Clostridiales bacterium]|nr:DeoR/GlpR transcriptional regulator [Clostridiales bacterium]OPZ68328.1 MAG: Glucitol operon repressor [Firmicutes bacterium ADurb.Bin467]